MGKKGQALKKLEKLVYKEKKKQKYCTYIYIYVYIQTMHVFCHQNSMHFLKSLNKFHSLLKFSVIFGLISNSTNRSVAGIWKGVYDVWPSNI